MISRKDQGGLPAKVPRLNIHRVQGDVNALVLQLTDVLKDSGITRHDRQLTTEQQVAGLGVITFNSAGDAAVPYREINAQIGTRSTFPFQAAITQIGGRQRGGSYIVVNILTGGLRGKGLVRKDGGITRVPSDNLIFS